MIVNRNVVTSIYQNRCVDIANVDYTLRPFARYRSKVRSPAASAIKPEVSVVTAAQADLAPALPTLLGMRIG
jgi:hypothetical protein